MRAFRLNSVKGSLTGSESIKISLSFTISNDENAGVNEFNRLLGMKETEIPVDIRIEPERIENPV